ncbi:MAG: TlpA family protein disulfide reductase [Oscillospiraceae bacterium]|nr:TlpA family protein disulfide reductase [Oscillospiraceae bacterium]
MVLLVLIFVALLLGATRLYDVLGSQVQMNNLATQATEGAEESAKQAAPDFTVYDADGNAHKLSDFKGKPVVLNFWATWCGFCKQEMPDFEEKYQQFGEDVHFLMVNVTDGSQETVEKASAFVEENGYTFPVYYDTDLDAAMAYNTSGLPVSYFIDAEGGFVAWQQGALTAQMLQTGIDMLLEN